MLKIIDIEIVMQSPEGKDFRFITFYDTNSLVEAKYKVYKSKQPYLWKNIEKAEKKSKETFTLSGKIEMYQGIDIVIFEGEAASEAYEKQKWKIKEKKILTREEAEKKVKTSQGYITDQNNGDSLTQEWCPIDNKAKKIKFRYYHKADKYDVKKYSFFKWTDWYDIMD